MVACERGETVLVHLSMAPDPPETGEMPRALSIPGISEALEVGGESMAERVALLSAIDDLKREGYVKERERLVEGLEGERNVYLLTPEGRERARDLRERVAEETIAVQTADGERHRVTLADVDEYLPEPALVRALARVTEDGVLYLQEEAGDRFVNRESELDRLESTLGTAKQDGHTVLVAGEAGVGKTTLVTGAFAETARDRGFQVWLGRCQEDAKPYAAYRSALEGALERVEGDPFEREGIDPEDEADYEAERGAMFEDVAELVAAEAVEDPLVLVIDDLHVADEPSIALFDHLAGRTPEGVLLVGTYRTEDLLERHPLTELADDAWVEAGDRSRIELAPFGRAEVRGLVQWVLGRRDVPESFVELVAEHTGGNPLFVEESVRRMLEADEVDPDHGIYPEAVDDLPVPDRVEDAINLRLSVLAEGTLEVLRIGALVGGVVPFGVLAAASDQLRPVIREHVELLVNCHVWERVGPYPVEGSGGVAVADGQVGVQFVSGLVRETVVDRIPGERRQDLHERVAEAIDGQHGDSPDRHAAVAHHYAAADCPEAAYEASLRAAERAKDVYAHEVALDNYERALELAREELDRSQEDPEVVDILEDVGDVYYLLGEYDEADRYYRYVRDRTDAPERNRRIARVRAEIRQARGSFEEALEIVEEALEEFGVEDTRGTALLFAKRGAQLGNLDDLDAAEEAYERCRGIAEEIDDLQAKATAYLDLGALDIRREAVDDDTVELLEAGVEAAREAGADRTHARALSNLAMAHRTRGELDAAETTARERLEIQDRIGDRVALSRAKVYLAWVLQARGKYDEAERLHREALETTDRLGNREITSRVHVDLGLLYADQNDLAAASDHFERAMEDAAAIDSDIRRAVAALDLADTEVARGNLGAAREAAEEGYELVTEAGVDHRVAFGTAVLGKVAVAEGRLEEAADLLREGIEAAQRAGDEEWATENRIHLSEALLASDVETAIEAAETAVDAAPNDGLEALARTRLGRTYRVDGQYERAESVLVDALSTIRDGDPETGFVNRVRECRALLELAHLAEARGDDSGVRGYATEGAEVAERYEIGRYLEEFDALLED